MLHVLLQCHSNNKQPGSCENNSSVNKCCWITTHCKYKQSNCHQAIQLQRCCIKILTMDKTKTTRNTAAKTAVLEVFEKSKTALSHTEIHKQLNDLCDRVTIYRVLDRLVEEGAVHRIVNVDGVIKYAECHDCEKQHHHNHVHFSCEKCKSVTCLEDVEPTFKLPQEYKIKEVNFTLSGLCPKSSITVTPDAAIRSPILPSKADRCLR